MQSSLLMGTRYPALGLSGPRSLSQGPVSSNIRFRAEDHYKNEHLERMFDQMGSRYETIVALGGLGFYRLWSRRAVNLLALKPGDKVCDMMAGTGDAWKRILPKIGPEGHITAIDLSGQMVQMAKARKAKLKADNVTVLKEDVLKSSVPTGSMDKVYSGFGVKTLPKEFYPGFVAEVKRVLKPGGRFSLVEASLPKYKWHQQVYRLYMKIGFFFLRRLFKKEDADQFAMVRNYMEDFQNCKALMAEFEKQGFQVKYVRMLGDGATGLVGQKADAGSSPV